MSRDSKGASNIITLVKVVSLFLFEDNRGLSYLFDIFDLEIMFCIQSVKIDIKNLTYNKRNENYRGLILSLKQ